MEPTKKFIRQLNLLLDVHFIKLIYPDKLKSVIGDNKFFLYKRNNTLDGEQSYLNFS